jgi:hypothetical protein
MAYTATNWVEGVTTLGPTNMNKIETELAALDGRAPPASLGYGTSLPGSPVDGQEAILVDSTTNPTYQWRFRYNASSTSAYKWEFIGGTPWFSYAYNGTWQPFSGNSTWVGSSPGFVLPRTGDYWLAYNAQFQSTTLSTIVQLQGGTSTSAFAPLTLSFHCNTTTTGVIAPALFNQRINGLAQGATLQPYLLADHTSTTVSSMACSVVPARVS